MDIKVRGSLGFTSLNNPVKPFTVKTKNDIITFKEIDYNKKVSNSFLQNMASFFLDNFANQSAHPFWKFCRKDTPTFNNKIYNSFLKDNMVPEYKKIIKNPDTTVLLGKNSKDELCAGIVSTPLNITDKIKNDKTLYIDSLAVDKEYRNNHVAQKLVDSVIDSSKGRYDDTFLVAYNESVPFYKKQGFSDIKNEEFITNLAEDRLDYPEYASFLSKKL